MSEEGLRQWESVEAAMEDAEAAYIDMPVEYGRVVKPDGKQILPDKKGTKKEISFSREEQRLMRDTDVFHNHPSGKSFSHYDLFLAISADVHRMIASGRNNLGIAYHHEILRPIKGWPDSGIERLKIAERAKRDLLKAIRDVEKAHFADVFWGQLPKEEFYANWDHEAMKRIASKYHLTYNRRRLDLERKE
ncbi:MAG: hypothetical protein NTX50_07345 [Candidatus Sumerlaeota bacterium]|nr:hypothetical protein [Candidatus Sumerlaeota bacterium]